MKKVKKKILYFLGKKLLPTAISILVKTYKLEVQNGEVLSTLKSDQPFIATFWHGKMLVPWFFLKRFKISALVSQSKDGEILTNVLQKLNYNMVRGSSNVGGKEALQLLSQKLEDGFSIALTPDGPTGPIYKLKPGAVILAKRLKAPIIFISIFSERKWNLNSWDKFEIPKPFSKVKLKISELIWVDDGLTFDQTDFFIKQLNEQFIREQNQIENS